MFETIRILGVPEELSAASAPGVSPDDAVPHLSNAFMAVLAGFRNRLYHGWPGAFLSTGGVEIEEGFSTQYPVLSAVLTSMREVQTITALGLNFKKYYKFKTICGLPDFGAPNNTGDGTAIRNAETIGFCIQFIVECAEKLNEFPSYIDGGFWDRAHHIEPKA